MAKAHNLTDETKRRFRRLDLNFLAHFFRHFEVSGGHNSTDETKRRFRCLDLNFLTNFFRHLEVVVTI